VRKGIRAKGVVVFEVNKDHSVALLELRSIGLNPVFKRKRTTMLRAAINAVVEIEGYLKSKLSDLGKKKEYVMFLGHKRRLHLVCIMYMSKRSPWRVKSVVLVSFAPGILKKISFKLENMSWRRILLFEYTKRYLTRKYY